MLLHKTSDTHNRIKTTNVSTETASSFSSNRLFHQHSQKLIVVAIWLILLGIYAWYARQNDLTPIGAVQSLINLLAHNFYGPLIFILVYLLRPILFFPATLLTVAAGFLFGPIVGIAATVVGANLSALFAFLIGRLLGQSILDSDKIGETIKQYANRLRHNSFETVIIMRLIFLPYDLVSYLAGALRIDWKAFLLTTVLGTIPGTVSVTLFGASLEGNFDGSLPELNPVTFGAAVIIFVSSLALSRWFRGRKALSMKQQPTEEMG